MHSLPHRALRRYQNEVGKGRFKKVFKGFDERRGIDVAWSKLSQESLDLNNAQLAAVAQEMRKGLDLDHPNIIKCYLTWQDGQAHCINLITEFFTSGNLREYRQRHKHLELKAVKKWARQILSGLDYLHTKEPPVVHGDLRCDKIYINGHSGEIKIGDLGLATLLPRRFPAGTLPAMHGLLGHHVWPSLLHSSSTHSSSSMQSSSIHSCSSRRPCCQAHVQALKRAGPLPISMPPHQACHALKPLPCPSAASSERPSQHHAPPLSSEPC